MTRTRVLVIGTGGTIASLSPDPMDLIDYSAHGRKLSAEELVQHLPPSLRESVDVVPLTFAELDSGEIGRDQWVMLAKVITERLALDPGLDGIVLTHGTATLEETGYALNLVLDTDRPVVLTGAQRPHSAVSADGPMNVVSAIRTAASPQACSRGVLVVLNDEIHAARHVTKTSTHRLQAFQSPEAGPVGFVDGDVTRFLMRVERLHTIDSLFSVADLVAAPRVDISFAHAGADGTAVGAFVTAGAAGIVSAGLLPGLVPSRERNALRAAHAAGCVVVQAARGLGSRVAPRRALQADGFIAADSLTPQKARILLMLSLGRGTPQGELQGIFDSH